MSDSPAPQESSLTLADEFLCQTCRAEIIECCPICGKKYCCIVCCSRRGVMNLPPESDL